MSTLLVMQIALVAEVNPGDPQDVERHNAEAVEIERQVMARLRRIQLGGRWRLRIFKSSDPTHVVLPPPKPKSETLEAKK